MYLEKHTKFNIVKSYLSDIAFYVPKNNRPQSLNGIMVVGSCNCATPKDNITDGVADTGNTNG